MFLHIYIERLIASMKLDKVDHTTKCSGSEQFCSIVQICVQFPFPIPSCLLSGVQHFIRVVIKIIFSSRSPGSLCSLLFSKLSLERALLLGWRYGCCGSRLVVFFIRGCFPITLSRKVSIVRSENPISMSIARVRRTTGPSSSSSSPSHFFAGALGTTLDAFGGGLVALVDVSLSDPSINPFE